MNPATTIQEARARGLKTYLCDKPCPEGHTGQRYLNGRCVACCNTPSVEVEPEPTADLPTLRARWQALEKARPMALLDYRTAPPSQVGVAKRLLVGINEAQDRLALAIAVAERARRLAAPNPIRP
jgi:hypothetical protein